MLADVLKAWHKQQGNPKTGLVFPSPVTGKQFDKQGMKKKWPIIRELAGLPDELQFYSLRHNFISQLVMKGHDLMSVAVLAGHSDIQMIIDHYGHLQPGKLKAMIVESFNEILEKPKDNIVAIQANKNREI